MVGTQTRRQIVAATSSLEEAEASYGARVAPVKLNLLDRRTPFRWESTLVRLGPVAIATQAYGGAFVGASTDGPDLHAMSFPLTALEGEATFGGITQPVAQARSTYLYSSSGSASFRYATYYRGVQLMIGANELAATLGALLGTALKEPCRFESRLSLERGVGPALERAVRYAVEESAVDDGLFGTAVAAQRFGESLLLRLIEGQPHNYAERLARVRRPAAPRPIRVAAEYLEANLARAVPISELAAVAGVSGRALQIGFQKYRGCTPAEFLRERRLAAARAQLLEGGHGASIAPIAKQCGFAHLGRFSARYRARFGELPTETRARKR